MAVDRDNQWMARALALAARARGQTHPNPMVGCVVVRDGELLAEGWHRAAGALHAEGMALEALGGRAEGATVYVTLEPCSHHGRTPPCAEALIRAGVRKVFVATCDPDPRVRGSGGMSSVGWTGSGAAWEGSSAVKEADEPTGSTYSRVRRYPNRPALAGRRNPLLSMTTTGCGTWAEDGRRARGRAW